MMGSNKEKKDTIDNDSVSYFEIFRYAKWYELMTTITGVLMAMLSGGGICYNIMQFGELSTSFIERTSRREVRSSWKPLINIYGGGRILTNASYEENMAALLEDGAAFSIGMVVSVTISIVLCVVSVALVNWSALRQITRIRKMFLEGVLRQDMAWFDTGTSFNLASMMTDDMTKLKDGMGEKMSIVGNLVGTSMFCIAAAIPQGWELSLACLTVVPLSIAASILMSNYQTQSSMRELESYSQAGKQAEEVLKGIRTVIAFGGEKKEVNKYARLLEPAEHCGRQRGLYTGLGTGFSWIITYCLNAIGLAYGARLVLNDYSKPADEQVYQAGDIAAIQFCMYMATQSITFCVPHGESFANASAAASTIFKILNRQPSIDSNSSKGFSPRRIKGNILLENISFNYPSRPDVEILSDVSLHIKAGETVALVGSSGCGKSTILQLVQRLYDPLKGTIKLDGIDVKNLNINWLRSSLGVVGQEPVLFRGTIFENISMGVPDATIEDVQRVAENAFAHDFIVRLPMGYDTLIGERGASLSGGQKQRIAIARALLREPAVLLLDEATSALDPHSERQVQSALDRAAQGRTTLVVSHRLANFMKADRVICMDQGKILESGTHDELLKLKGFYYNLVKTKDGDHEPDIIETVQEDEEGNENLGIHLHRAESKRMSTRRRSRRRSIRRGSNDWVCPRGSISSVISTGIQNFVYNCEAESKDDINDEDIQKLSDWELLKLNGPEWPLMVVGAIAAFIQGGCFPAFALIFGYSFGIFAMTDFSEILRLADMYSGLFVVVAAVAGITMCLQSISFTNAGLKMTSRLRKQYFSSLLNQEMGYYDLEQNSVGSLCSRLSGDTAEVQGATGIRVGLILQGVSSVAVGIIMGFCYDWKLTLVGSVFLPVVIASNWLEGVVSQKSQNDERAAMEATSSIATEAIISIKTVQCLCLEKTYIDKFEQHLNDAVEAIVNKTKWRGLVLGLGINVPFLAYCSCAAYGCSLIASENLPYSVVLLVNESLMYGSYMLGQSLVYVPSFNSAKLCAARIMTLINRIPKIKSQDESSYKKDWSATGNVNLSNVEFSYPSRPYQQVLKCLSLKIEAGKSLALVGSSGCGKSTILQLLQRFYDVDSGVIEIDGKDIQNGMTLPALRRQLGVVQQEPVLFDRTIGENIAYGDTSRKLPMHEIIAAAKAANIHNFIVSLPKGYDTNLGLGGAQLSGGQKQRVCIARALVRRPRLLLLDEATSALDANSEKAVSDALDAAAKGRTCITIAHRLSTIRHADVICVVEKGKIVEQGCHDELMCLQGHYWRLNKGETVATQNH